MKKSDLFEFLDWFTFVNESEIYMAVEDFLTENMLCSPSRWTCFYASKLWKEYIEERKLKFEEDEADLWEREIAENDLKEEIILPF